MGGKCRTRDVKINDEDTGRMNGITNGVTIVSTALFFNMSNRFFKTNVFVTMVLQTNEQIDLFEKNFVKFLTVGQKTVTFCLLQNNVVTQFYLFHLYHSCKIVLLNEQMLLRLLYS